jgi:hypothetical protein
MTRQSEYAKRERDRRKHVAYEAAMREQKRRAEAPCREQTNQVSYDGACLRCGAAMGERGRCPC